MLEINYRKTAELIPYARNSRTHSTEQVQQIAGSIKEFGFTNPLLIDESDGIIAGHGRLMGAKLLKMDEVPCIVLSGLSEAQKKAYVIADNKIALNAGWDEDLLKLELMELDEMGFDYSELGFDFDFDIEEINEDEEFGDKNKEVDIDSYEDIMELKFKLSFAEYQEAQEKLKDIASSPENALRILLKMEI